MRTIYWRCAYTESDLPVIVSSEDFNLPDFTRWPLAKNTKEKLLEDIKVGHYILLANFDRTNEVGNVKHVGEVVSKSNTNLQINWKKPIPSWMLTPNRQGGVKEWINEAMFSFDDSVAKRYKLSVRVCKLFS